jgi:pyridoxine 4-dehydrogenase
VTKLGGKRTPDKGWVSALRPEELRKGCEEDLKGLRLERVDVVNLRWISHTEVPFREALDAMIALKKEGKIRQLSLSNVSLAQIQEAFERTEIVGVENLYNVAAGEKQLGALPHASVADQERIVDLCAERKIAFLPFFSLAIPGPPRKSEAVAKVAKRHGATEAQIATAWLLARSKAMLPIPGTCSVEHLEENWNARKILLSKEDIQEISAAREA